MIPLKDTIKSKHLPVVTWLLIAVNVLIFLYQLTLPPHALERFFHTWGIVPARFFHPRWASATGYPRISLLPFFTYMFLHGGWLHIIFNMWALWIFGDNVEDRMGHLGFFGFYILCGLLAGLIQTIFHPGSQVPTIGASGAIAGVMGAYFILFPFSQILVMMPIFIFPIFFKIPAVVYLLLWFILQFWSGTLSLLAGAAQFGGIAFWAHVAGFISGMALLRIFVKKIKSGYGAESSK